jgi:hypothetical protein
VGVKKNIRTVANARLQFLQLTVKFDGAQSTPAGAMIAVDHAQHVHCIRAPIICAARI